MRLSEAYATDERKDEGDEEENEGRSGFGDELRNRGNEEDDGGNGDGEDHLERENDVNLLYEIPPENQTLRHSGI